MIEGKEGVEEVDGVFVGDGGDESMLGDGNWVGVELGASVIMAGDGDGDWHGQYWPYWVLDGVGMVAGAVG